MNLRKIHFPSIGVMGLVIGSLIRVLAIAFHGPFVDVVVIFSDVALLISIAWILMFDLFPIFLEPFYFIRNRYARRQSFFVALLVLYIVMQIITFILPSGRTKDITTTLAFLSFASAVTWFLGVYITQTFTPLIRHIKYVPREAERITFADIVTSMAIIIVPTLALSFIFLPTGLSRQEISPYQVFITSLLTNIAILAYLYLFIIRRKVFSLRQLGVRKIDREDAGKAFVLFLFVSILIVVIETFLERIGISLQQYSFSSKQGALLALIMTVGITPFFEELYFRGFLFKGLLLHNKPWVAYVTSALLFSILHPPLLVMMEVFIIGLLLAYIVQETKSIWPGVFIHMINNAIVFGYLLYSK